MIEQVTTDIQEDCSVGVADILIFSIEVEKRHPLWLNDISFFLREQS